MANERILVVEDESIVALDLENKLEERGYGVIGLATTGREAINKAVSENPDLILMDIKLDGDIDGIEAASRIRHKMDVPIVYLTAFGDDKILKRAKITEPVGYLVKPYAEETLHATIQMALSRYPKEKLLRLQTRWFSQGLNSIDSGIVMTDEKGGITFINRTAKNMIGWKDKSVSGENINRIMQMYSPDGFAPLKSPALTAVSTNQPVTIAHCLLRSSSSAEELSVSVNARPVQNAYNTPMGSVLVVTALKEQTHKKSPVKTAIEQKVTPPHTTRKKTGETAFIALSLEKDDPEQLREAVDMESGECEVYFAVFRDAVKHQNERAFEYLSLPLLDALFSFYRKYLFISRAVEKFPERKEEFAYAEKALARLKNGLADANRALELLMRDRIKNRQKKSSGRENISDNGLFDWPFISKLDRISDKKHPFCNSVKSFQNKIPGLEKNLKQAWENSDRRKIEATVKSIVALCSDIDAYPVKGLVILCAVAVLLNLKDEARSLFAKLNLAIDEVDTLVQNRLPL
jgi:PAS domain S-box-containing protein